MISVVLIIAVARSVTVLMGETGLDVWLLEQAAGALQGVAAFVFAPLGMIIFMGLSVLIPSSSGLATVSMPIMAPLADQLGFSVETTIMLFVAASGVINLITPTSGALVGGLALAKLQYSTWIKFFLKLFVILAVVNMVILTVAMMFLPAPPRHRPTGTWLPFGRRLAAASAACSNPCAGLSWRRPGVLHFVQDAC